MLNKKSYQSRSLLCSHPLAKKLLSLMENKQTNLAFSADLTSSRRLLELVDQIGPEICVLKTHIDILDDFTPEVVKELRRLADKHEFLIFEDRKFADIGSTVLAQYRGGIYRIADWADLINAHILPGPGIIEGLKEIGLPKGRALLLLAQLSSAGSLARGDYTQHTIKMAEEYSDFVIGFISQQKLSENPAWIYLTPGIQQSTGKDGLGQQYHTPEAAIAAGSDILIVGRGIYGAHDPVAQAALYRQAGWQAYVQSLR
jgi:uridine monophosphate synthetase